MSKHNSSLSKRLPEDISTRIYEDIGHASTCWTNLEGAGTFESEQASKIALELCHYIADKLEKV